MAGTSDKARFYLEQSVPELQELAKKEIFTSDEITAITKKRSDFEHIVNARGSSSGDWARYAEYEMNLDTLKRKRAQRMGIKAGGHTGPRRIFFVLERGTRKFHGDVALWLQYLRFSRDQKAFKRSSKILTSALRFHPTRPELWMYAANYAMEEQGDMTEARSYMQRGLRFCKGSIGLWLAYARLELIYMAKIVARRQILGLDSKQKRQQREEVPEEADADHIALPIVTAEEMEPGLLKGELDSTAQALEMIPTSSGAIVMAIYDAAMNHFSDSNLGERFFDMVLEFDTIPSQAKLLQHILDRLTTSYSTSPSTMNCFIRQPFSGIDRRSSAFPKALGISIGRLRQAEKNPDLMLTRKSISWMAELLQDKDLDQDLRKVLSMITSQSLNQYLGIHKSTGDGSADEILHLLQDSSTCGLEQLASTILDQVLELWPAHQGLQRLKKEIGQRSAQDH